MMRFSRKFMCATTCFMAAMGHTNSASALDPNDTWLTEDGRARVRVEHCGMKKEQICGYVVWARETVDAKGHAFLDENNPDPAKRSRRLLGHQLILGLSPSADGRYTGQIYNAQNGQYYKITVWRELDQLKVKGCMMSVLCMTQSWSLTANILQGQLIGRTGDPEGPTPDKEWAEPTSIKSTTVTKAPK